MRKTLIVAKREFVENLRTKTFWIGIAALPVIFALSIFVARFMEKHKDVRTYAILDRSDGEWLSRAIDERAARTDLEAIGRAQAEGSEKEREAIRKRIQTWFESLPPDHPLPDLLNRLAPIVGVVSASDFLDPSTATEAMKEKLQTKEAIAVITSWALTTAQNPKHADALRSLASGISLARYRRVSLADLGVGNAESDAAVEKALNDAINQGKLFAYFVVPAEPLVAGKGSYVSNNLTDDDLRDWFGGHATEIVRQQRINALENVSEAEARSLLATFDFTEQKVSSTGQVEAVASSAKASNWAPAAFVYLLWIAVFTAAQMLLTNTVEEKSNRLIEVLLSSVSPIELMSGKVLGIAMTGLTIVVSWVTTAIVGSKLIPSGSKLSALNLGAIIGDPLYLGSFIAYFLAGYLLYAAILVAIGSVCDSLKESQNLLQPVFVILIVPLLAMIPVVQDPNGAIARVMTYIPLYTPFLMMNRAGGPPPAWEYVASSVVILVSLVIAFWAAAKIFRVGILMTGKPPRVMDMLRWLRAPIGAVHTRPTDQKPNSN